jgi:hypothetical protein
MQICLLKKFFLMVFECKMWRGGDARFLEDCAITRRAAFTDSGARVGNYPTAVRTMARDSENS